MVQVKNYQDNVFKILALIAAVNHENSPMAAVFCRFYSKRVFIVLFLHLNHGIVYIIFRLSMSLCGTNELS